MSPLLLFFLLLGLPNLIDLILVKQYPLLLFFGPFLVGPVLFLNLASSYLLDVLMCFIVLLGESRFLASFNVIEVGLDGLIQA
jgi:hypothetical protein